MNSPDISDISDFDGNDIPDDDPTLSDNDYIDSNGSLEDDNISIDMDEKPKSYSNKILGKLIIKPKPTPETIPKINEPIKSIKKIEPITDIDIPKSKPKLNITKKNISSSNTDDNETKLKQNTKQEKNNETNETNKEKREKKERTTEEDTKEDTKDEQKGQYQFEINEQTIDFWSKEIDFKKHCCKKSPIKNDLGVLCLMIKLGYFKDYRCNVKKCRVTKSWYNKPIQLILNRKNNVMDDLTPSNLELLCPNCYMSIHGVELFNKIINHTIFKCKICGFPLSNFGNSKKKTGFCMSCEHKIINSSFDSKQYEYIQELKKTTHELEREQNSNHNTDDFTNTNYYNEISQFKSFKHHDKEILKSKQSSKFDDKPIIKLNMSVPDLDQLLGDEF
jgi:hypothetical protein